MKKLYKRSTAIAVSALMMSQMIPYNVFASEVITGPNSLTINPYKVTEEVYNGLAAPNDSPTGRLGDSGRAGQNGIAFTDNITFNIQGVDVYGDVIESGEDGYYSAVADSNETLANIPDGNYKITPINPTTENRTGYNFNDAEAFFIQLPSYADGEKNTNVYIYPKLIDNANTTDPDDAEKDPSVPSDEDPTKTDNKHSIKLTKILSDSPTAWKTGVSEAVFDIYYKDAMNNWVDAGNFTTTNGVLIVDGLPLGKYYAVEKTAPGGYLLNQEPVFFDLDGSGTITKQVQTLTNDKKLTVSKVIDVDGEGDDFNWTITADVPSQPEKLISYSVTDTYTNLTGVEVVSVKSGNNNVAYTFSNSGNNLTITITNPSALTAEVPLVIKVKSKLAEGFISGSNATNTSSIDYQYAYDPDDDDRIDNGEIPDDIPNIPNPDPNDPDPTDPDNPPVVSYPDGTEEEPHNTETVKPATITISNYATGTTTELKNGKYNITGCSEHNDSDSDNMVTLANLAPGVYEITQLGTQANYKIDETVKTIFIDKDGTVYEGNAAVTGKELANNKVIFYNAPISDNFQLPFTGTTATIVFTIGGIAIMAGAAFFIIVLFKKKDEEEEEQNKA